MKIKMKNVQHVENLCQPSDIRKNLTSKKIISLKTKPLESLIILHKILNKAGIPSEEIITLRKEYYSLS